MRVQKRNGDLEEVSFDKVLNRLSKLSKDISVDYFEVAKKVCNRIYDGVNTNELDDLAANICSSMIVDNPDYDRLASRVSISNHHKKTLDKFSDTIERLFKYKKTKLISDDVYNVVQRNSEILDSRIQYERDYMFDYFGFKTLERSYLLSIDGKAVERPQDMWMRVSIGIHGDDIEKVLETYDCMSLKLFTHATPTLFNFGTKREQGSSCFVAGTNVYTVNRGPVPIENIEIGDSVITHTGSTKAVVQIHENKLDNRQLFDVKVNKTPSIRVTGNHRFFSITNEQLNWKESPQWNSIEHLRVGDWIAIPKSSTTTFHEKIDLYQILKDAKNDEADHWTYLFEFDKDKMRRITHYKSEYRPNGVKITGEWFERYVTVDENFAWFLGAWYGDGSIQYGRSSNKHNRTKTHKGISFCQNPDNTQFIQDVVKIGEKYLGVHATVYHQKNRNWLSVSFNNSAIGHAFNILFGRWSNKKFLWPSMYSWSRELVAAFLGGIISSDGCCTRRGGIELQLTNQELIESIFHLSRAVGFDTSITIMHKSFINKNEERIVQKCGRMSFPWLPEIMSWVKKHYDDERLTECRERANTKIEIDGNIFLRINCKSKVFDDIPKFVYTLGVEDDHSYAISGLIAENCFLVNMQEDSVSGMYDTLRDVCLISKFAGGIGLHIHNVRANGSLIRGTNGKSTGIVPMLRVYNDAARHINQAGKRNGSFAIYIEPWHADIEAFLDLKKNHGAESERARDLFYALWVNDEFMRRVQQNATWSLMCPDQCPGLSDVFDDGNKKQFTELYTRYEREGKYVKQVKAQDIWMKILESQIETGSPYMLYKDACNSKSNQKNLGTIKSSNLCVAPETRVFTDTGVKAIAELEDETVNVFNGHEYSEVTVFKTASNKELLTVETEHGHQLRCTKDHEFFVQQGSDEIIVKARDLVPGMRLASHRLPVIQDNQNTVELKYSYTHGFLCGNFSSKSQKSTARCTFNATESGLCGIHEGLPREFIFNDGRCQGMKFDDQKTLVLTKDQFHHKKKLVYDCEQNYFEGIRVALPRDIAEKYMVPIDFNIKSKVMWLSGLIDSAGSIDTEGNITLSIGDNTVFLREVLMLMQTLGAKGWLVEEGNALVIGKVALFHLKNSGLDIQFQTIVPDSNQISAPICDCIKNVMDLQQRSDTYCFTEKKRNRAVFEGVLTSQCSEIIQYTSPDEIAVCNLASICLPSYIDEKTNTFDFTKMQEVVRVATCNLNKIIDKNFYPVEKARVSNMKHRPIGIGVQGLADTFLRLNLAFDSPEAKQLNKRIFENIYFAAIQKSCELAREFGPYESYDGSPASMGVLQFDMWEGNTELSCDWQSLKQDISKHGLRNSLVCSPMPTASTSQIMGNTESFEPIQSNIYKRKTLAGEFIILNKYLVHELKSLGMWDENMKNKLIANNGSVQEIEGLSEELKSKYKTVWEMKQKTIIELASDRGRFIDQSQSMNLYFESPTFSKVTKAHFFGWQSGLKTGMYYLRSKAKAETQKFSIDASISKKNYDDSANQPCESCSA